MTTVNRCNGKQWVVTPSKKEKADKNKLEFKKLALSVFMCVFVLNFVLSYNLGYAYGSDNGSGSIASSSERVTTNDDKRLAPDENNHHSVMASSTDTDENMRHLDTYAPDESSRSEHLEPKSSESTDLGWESGGSRRVQNLERHTDAGFSYIVNKSLDALLIPLEPWQKHWRSTLTSSDALLYDKCYESILSAQSFSGTSEQAYIDVLLSGELSAETISNVKRALEHDEPRFFHIDFNNSKPLYDNGKQVGIRFIIRDGYSTAELYHKALLSIESVVSEWLDKIKPNMDVYQMYGVVFHCFDSDKIAYGIGKANEKAMDAVFLHKKAVRQGYCKAFTYLLQRLGMNSFWVDGIQTAYGSSNHSWNYVKLYNQWFLADVLWGDRWFLTGEKSCVNDVTASNKIPDMHFGIVPKLAAESICDEVALVPPKLANNQGTVGILRDNYKVTISFDDGQSSLNQSVSLGFTSLGNLSVPMSKDSKGIWTAEIDIVKLKRAETLAAAGKNVTGDAILFDDKCEEGRNAEELNEAFNQLKAKGFTSDFYFTVNGKYRTGGNVHAGGISYSNENGSIYPRVNIVGTDLENLSYDCIGKVDGGSSAGGESDGSSYVEAFLESGVKGSFIKSVATKGQMKDNVVLVASSIDGDAKNEIFSSQSYQSTLQALGKMKYVAAVDVTIVLPDKANLLGKNLGDKDRHKKGVQGPVSVIFRLDKEYAGKKMTVVHLRDDVNGEPEVLQGVVNAEGELTIVVRSFSPFIVFEDLEHGLNVEEGGSSGAEHEYGNGNTNVAVIPNVGGSVGNVDATHKLGIVDKIEGTKIIKDNSGFGNVDVNNLVTQKFEVAALNNAKEIGNTPSDFVFKVGEKISQTLSQEIKKDSAIREQVVIMREEASTAGPIGRFCSMIVPAVILFAALIALYYANKSKKY